MFTEKILFFKNVFNAYFTSSSRRVESDTIRAETDDP
jgi:hypothetical protein